MAEKLYESPELTRFLEAKQKKEAEEAVNSHPKNGDRREVFSKIKCTGLNLQSIGMFNSYTDLQTQPKKYSVHKFIGSYHQELEYIRRIIFLLKNVTVEWQECDLVTSDAFRKMLENAKLKKPTSVEELDSMMSDDEWESYDNGDQRFTDLLLRKKKAMEAYLEA